MGTTIIGRQSNWCACYQAYSYDDSLPIEQIILTGIDHPNNKSCPEHSGLTSAQRHSALSDESRRKEYTLYDIKSNIIDLSELDLEGQLVFKKGISANLSWTGTGNNRILHIIISGYTLTNQQKSNLQTTADAKFGVGKVVFD